MMPENQGKFKKGKSGNPKGRPPKYASLTSLLKIEIDKMVPGDTAKRTWKELIVIATMKLAIQGNRAALREIWERMDGKVAQVITGDPAAPVMTIVVQRAADLPDEE